MLSKKKIKIMFQLALYERKDGRKDLKRIRYYKNDYVRLNILKSIICMTIGYLLMIALFAFYHMEYLISNAISLPYKSYVLTAVGIYILLLALYVFVTVFVYAVQYDASRSRVQKYYRFLKYLNRYYNVEDETVEEEQ